jgi:predicted short-subunit dehydrogenase-like oxidoreductase (DUF2520 family)
METMGMAAKGPERAAQAKHYSESAQRPTSVSIIGAGRLGTALALALANCGYTIEALVARSQRHARRAVRLSGTHARALTATQLDQLPQSDLLFITTPDDAIPSTAAQLAATFHRESQRGRTVLHASGALSSQALSDLRAVGFATGSLHPLVSVSEPVQGASAFSAAFFCVEGDSRAARIARKVVRDLGAQSFFVNSADKALYHAAAVMASGHLVALFDIASEMLMGCGLTAARARAVLLPLLRSTIENLSVRAPSDALTGTFARADLATMRSHLAAIRERASTEALSAYVLLGLRSLQLAGQKGVDRATLKEMERVLKSKAGR